MKTDDLDVALGALTQLGATCESRERFRTAALRRLQLLVGFDSGIFCSREPEIPRGDQQTGAHKLESFAAKYEAYVEELRPIERAAMANGGVAIDTQVLSPRARKRMAFYTDIVRPQGVRSLLAAYLMLRGQPTAVVYLARHRPSSPLFGNGECVTMRQLLPALALGDGIHAVTDGWAGAAVTLEAGVDWTQLTSPERDIVQYVALGLRNADIAVARGTSPNTVRNQLTGIFEKMAVANRTELARLAVASGLGHVPKRAKQAPK